MMKPTTTYMLTLLAATGVSLAGNIRHASLAYNGATEIGWAIFWAAIPPLMLPLAVHVAGVRAKHAAGADWVRKMTVAGVSGVAVAVFIMSFFALRDLTLAMGAPTVVAVLMPLALDLLAMLATIALLSSDTPAAVAQALDHAADSDSEDTPSAVSPASAPTPDYPMLDPSSRWATVTTGDIPVITDSTPEPVAVVQREATDVALSMSPAPVAEPAVALSADMDDSADSDMSSEVSDTADSPVDDTSMSASTGDSDTAPVADTAPAPTAAPPADSAATDDADIPDSDLDAARAVVRATGIKSSAHDVAAVIEALGRGDALAVIARETGVHRTTVRRVRDHIADSAPAPQRQLAAVS
ncbi:DUF2637 domain-containing protein [Tsukamurella ocularis]